MSLSDCARLFASLAPRSVASALSARHLQELYATCRVESATAAHGHEVSYAHRSRRCHCCQCCCQVPLKLPPELLDVFWGYDCMAPAGLAPRLYAWLKV